MKNKKPKKFKKDLSKGERRFGVVLESIDSKLNLVVEGHCAFDKKIDKNHLEFQEFREEVNYKLNSHTEMLNSHNEMIGRLATNVEIIKTDIEFIKNGLKKKVDIDEFIVLEKRVAALEKLRR